jgi:ATP-binding cassette subfamily F protein 3
MIAINNLTFEIGARALYDEANWHIKPGEKIFLICAHRNAKTTQLKNILLEYKKLALWAPTEPVKPPF